MPYTTRLLDVVLTTKAQQQWRSDWLRSSKYSRCLCARIHIGSSATAATAAASAGTGSRPVPTVHQEFTNLPGSFAAATASNDAASTFPQYTIVLLYSRPGLATVWKRGCLPSSGTSEGTAGPRQLFRPPVPGQHPPLSYDRQRL